VERMKTKGKTTSTTVRYRMSSVGVVYDRTQPIPRLSKAGMPSHSEGWGGLFKDDSTG
jgi:hypothetical protein